ncbi:hypothetical protein [Streptomyces sp. NPDC059262]|uniref:hypothetical protein n=1 Tax=Streptomyces sp. NPDC059262 TaxID=3346797 RepID=UPI00368788CF
MQPAHVSGLVGEVDVHGPPQLVVTLILVLLDTDKADLVGPPGRASTGADRGSVAASGPGWGSTAVAAVGLSLARGQCWFGGLRTSVTINLSRADRC